jgi:hypothetical protein
MRAMTMLLLAACQREPPTLRENFCLSLEIASDEMRRVLDDAIEILGSDDPRACSAYRIHVRDAERFFIGFVAGAIALQQPYVSKVFATLRIDKGTYEEFVYAELGELQRECSESEPLADETRTEHTMRLRTINERFEAAIAICPSSSPSSISDAAFAGFLR